MSSKSTNNKQRTKPFIFTTQDEEIITDAVAPFNMLTAGQITAIIRPGKPGNLTKVQTRLTRLTNKRYLIADPLETKRGQRPYIYALGIKGKRYREEHGFEVRKYFKPSEFEHRTYKRMHTLELNNFLILASTLPMYTSSLTFSDLRHELQFERDPLKYLDAATGQERTIKPDALFKLQHKRKGEPDLYYHCWVELDRDTESDERMMRKFSCIYDYISRGYFADYYGNGPGLVFIVTTAGAKQGERLKKLFRQEFPKVNPTSAQNQMFKFASIPPLTKPQPTPLAVFCAPFWTTAYGASSTKLQTIIKP
jgi:Replication-relaxation